MPTLSPLETHALTLFADGVRRTLGPRVVRVVLFGSRARGEGHAESDLDARRSPAVIDEAAGLARAREALRSA